MKIRRRAFPILDQNTRDAVRSGKSRDPQSGAKATRGADAIRMRTNGSVKPVIHPRDVTDR